MEYGQPNHPQGNGKHKETNNCYGQYKQGRAYDYDKGIKKVEPTRPNEKFPKSIIRIRKEHESKVFHPTQKSVELLRYLIRTYTNEGDVVLDNAMGSGSTIVAAIKEKRHFIGIEKNEEYFEKANKRIKEEQKQLTLF
jgi:DNA modification methylase